VRMRVLSVGLDGLIKLLFKLLFLSQQDLAVRRKAEWSLKESLKRYSQAGFVSFVIKMIRRIYYQFKGNCYSLAKNHVSPCLPLASSPPKRSTPFFPFNSVTTSAAIQPEWMMITQKESRAQCVSEWVPLAEGASDVFILVQVCDSGFRRNVSAEKFPMPSSQ
jgi:hypothetical protein